MKPIIRASVSELQDKITLRKSNSPFIRWDWTVRDWQIQLFKEKILSPISFAILAMIIIPETIGHRSGHPRCHLELSASEIGRQLGMDRRNIHPALKELQKFKIIDCVQPATRQKPGIFRFNKAAEVLVIPEMTGKVLVIPQMTTCHPTDDNKAGPCHPTDDNVSSHRRQETPISPMKDECPKNVPKNSIQEGSKNPGPDLNKSSGDGEFDRQAAMKRLKGLSDGLQGANKRAALPLKSSGNTNGAGNGSSDSGGF